MLGCGVQARRPMMRHPIRSPTNSQPPDACRGNMGAGLTHLIMPYIYSGMAASQPDFIAWRCAYFVPGFAQVRWAQLRACQAGVVGNMCRH